MSTAPQDFELITTDTGLVRIGYCFPSGFLLNNMKIHGSVICYGDTFLLWKPKSIDEIDIDSLAILDLLKPIPDLVVLGCGKTGVVPPPQHLVQALWKKGVALEVSDTNNAAATFNLLNQEGRKVVGALLPLAS
jgi:NADH dehydrogenase [ubiquinone] 1 alpha subcomplex assembly factor 3